MLFFPSSSNMQSAALQAKPDSGPIGETSKRKEKCLRLKCIWTLQMISLASRANILLLFMTGAADFKIQVTVQLRISLSSDLRAGWRFLRALKCTLASKVKHVVRLDSFWVTPQDISKYKEAKKKYLGLKHSVCFRTSFLTHFHRAPCVTLRHFMCLS